MFYMILKLKKTDSKIALIKKCMFTQWQHKILNSPPTETPSDL